MTGLSSCRATLTHGGVSGLQALISNYTRCLDSRAHLSFNNVDILLADTSNRRVPMKDAAYRQEPNGADLKGRYFRLDGPRQRNAPIPVLDALGYHTAFRDNPWVHIAGTRPVRLIPCADLLLQLHRVMGDQVRNGLCAGLGSRSSKNENDDGSQHSAQAHMGTPASQIPGTLQLAPTRLPAPSTCPLLDRSRALGSWIYG
jgi:hypothetical protein